MSDGSKIQWLARPGTKPATWNPYTGCTPVSEGCRNCSARRMAYRLAGRYGYPKDKPFSVVFHQDHLSDPLRWRKPRTIFVCSMGDLWHPKISERQREGLFEIVNLAPQHTYICVTKRLEAVKTFPQGPNCWLGVSVEDINAKWRCIGFAFGRPTVLFFISAEPLLGPFDLPAAVGLCEVDWLVIGCETGPHRRPCELRWVDDLINDADSRGTPVFIKQLEIDGKVTANPADWPKWARRREWPKTEQLT